MKLWVVGLDGMRPDALLRAPDLLGFVTQSAHTLSCTTATAPMSGPSWATLMSGRLDHGVDKNAVVESPRFRWKVPNLFQCAHARGFHTAAHVSSWKGMNQLVQDCRSRTFHPCATTVAEADAEVLKASRASLDTDQDTLLFSYLNQVDASGHEHGFGTPAYQSTVNAVSRDLTPVLWEATGLGWAVALVTDHGGSAWATLTQAQKKEYVERWGQPHKGVHGLDLPSHTSTFFSLTSAVATDLGTHTTKDFAPLLEQFMTLCDPGMGPMLGTL